jgi:hypothetical protein
MACPTLYPGNIVTGRALLNGGIALISEEDLIMTDEVSVTAA